MTEPRHTHTPGGVVMGPQGMILVVNQCGNSLKTIVKYLFKTQEIELQPQDPKPPEACWLTPNQVLERLAHVRDLEFFTQTLPHIEPYLKETMI